MLVVAVICGTLLLRAGRPCGSGEGEPLEVVEGVLTALQERDERGLCQRLSFDHRIPDEQAAVLRERIAAAGGLDAVSIAEVPHEQMGALHVLVVTGPDGELVGRFQTVPGERGTVVVGSTTSASRW